LTMDWFLSANEQLRSYFEEKGLVRHMAQCCFVINS